LYLHTLIFPLGLGQLSTLFLSSICLSSPLLLLLLLLVCFCFFHLIIYQLLLFRPDFRFLLFHMYAFPGFPNPCLSVASLPGPFHLNVALSYYTFPPPSYFYLFIYCFSLPFSFLFCFFFLPFYFIYSVPAVKVNISGFNSRVDAA